MNRVRCDPLASRRVSSSPGRSRSSQGPGTSRRGPAPTGAGGVPVATRTAVPGAVVGEPRSSRRGRSRATRGPSAIGPVRIFGPGRSARTGHSCCSASAARRIRTAMAFQATGSSCAQLTSATSIPAATSRRAKRSSVAALEGVVTMIRAPRPAPGPAGSEGPAGVRLEGSPTLADADGGLRPLAVGDPAERREHDGDLLEGADDVLFGPPRRGDAKACEGILEGPEIVAAERVAVEAGSSRCGGARAGRPRATRRRRRPGPASPCEGPRSPRRARPGRQPPRGARGPRGLLGPAHAGSSAAVLLSHRRAGRRWDVGSNAPSPDLGPWCELAGGRMLGRRGGARVH